MSLSGGKDGLKAVARKMYKFPIMNLNRGDDQITDSDEEIIEILGRDNTRVFLRTFGKEIRIMLPLRRELFWDIDYDHLDPEKHKRVIIERVLSYGNLQEFFFILGAYSPQTLKGEIKRLGYLDPKTISFVAGFFNISQKRLKCYTRKQSQEIHWD